MFLFLRKSMGFSNCIYRNIESALKPVFGVEKYFEKMPYSRGIGGNGPRARRPYYEDYDYDFGRNGGMLPQPKPGGKWPPIPTFQSDATKPSRIMDHSHLASSPSSSSIRYLGHQTLAPDQRANCHGRPINVNCGELRLNNCGTVVHMKGRVQHQRLNRFILLRDSHGTTQLVALEERLDLIRRIRNIPIDSHIEIVGTVQERPFNTINYTMATGEIEVVIGDILDVATPKRKFNEVSEDEAIGRTRKKARSSILITSAEILRCVTPSIKKKFLERTHNCGELNDSKANIDVTLCGWIESKRNERFFILRDGYGATQLVVSTNDCPAGKVLSNSEPNKTLVVIKGKVSLRPSHQRNTRMATGNIEVKVSSAEIIDPNEPDLKQVNKDGDEIETEKMSAGEESSPGNLNSYCSRTHTCGQLRGSDVGVEVTLCGWLDSQRGTRFGTIRDGHGSTQLLVPSDFESTLGKKMLETPLESVITITGTVCARPPEQISEKLATGEIEVLLKEYSVLNPAKRDLPFVIREHNRPKEHLRMKYRYLDMRFKDMQQRLRLRSKVLMRMREFLINQRGFVEVETPTLFRRTPGGAQEYVVPTRTEGKFYSLVQSPQQLKQLLMVGAMDRYFQVARCYRDEGARPDRQPEFTQMDIELSFTDRQGILSLIEDLLKASWPEELEPLATPFPVLTYHDAMHSYGSDKPDLSFGKKLVDISDLITEENKTLLPENLRNINNFTAKALVFNHDLMFKLKKTFQECEKDLKQKSSEKAKLTWVKCPVNKWKETLTEALPFLDIEQLKETLELQFPCSVVVGIGKDTALLPLMGKLRQEVFSEPTSNFHFAWIIDFPLFLEGDDGNLESAHHPFTRPLESDTQLMESDPLRVRGLHFDLVLNGYEVGGGSVRIHEADLQIKVLKDILKIQVDSLQHLLEALSSGAPPHGGIALGMDRLLSIMVGAESIRDVIAFPKGVDGKDPLSGAPCEISEEEKKMYNLIPKLSVKQEDVKKVLEV